MEALKVCAVVVTYQPEMETVRNLKLLASQADEVVVVDNGSSACAVEMLDRANAQQAFFLERNTTNEGVAAALNTGVRYALARGHRWVLLFDQDSTVTPGFVAAMFSGYREHTARDSAGIFCPHYIDRESGAAVVTTGTAADGGPMVAMTSGSLMPSWAFERCGSFMEELFIDQVDVEYCFRLRAMGYTIARSPEARLLHSAGSPRRYGKGSPAAFQATHHSAARRYYITRNRVWVVRQYWRQHRDWCLPMLRSIVTDTFKVILVEDTKIAKVRSTFAGVRDALSSKLGKRREL